MLGPVEKCVTCHSGGTLKKLKHKPKYNKRLWIEHLQGPRQARKSVGTKADGHTQTRDQSHTHSAVVRRSCSDYDDFSRCSTRALSRVSPSAAGLAPSAHSPKKGKPSVDDRCFLRSLGATSLTRLEILQHLLHDIEALM